MTNQTPIEEATGYLEARRYQNAILRQEDCAPIDTIHGKPLTARTVAALLEQIRLDEQRLTELRRQLDAAEAQPCDHDSDAFQALERLHSRIHRDFNFDAGECAPPTEDEIALRLMDDLVTFADEVYLPLADATTKRAEVAETRTEWATRQRHPNGAEEPTDPVSESMARMRVAKYPWHIALLSREVRYGPWTEVEPNPLESAVTEALADIAANPADPEPAPAAPPWLVEAGDD